MPKKEKEPEVEANLEIPEVLGSDKFGIDLFKEIFRLTGEIKDEIQWLEQYCPHSFGDCGSVWDLQDLIELRNALETARNQLKRQTYIQSYGSVATRYLYGEISEEEFMKTRGY